MIEIEHLNKTYPSPGGDIHALRDVNLRIEDGEIFGIIGLSGAGKSTVACVFLALLILGRRLMGRGGTSRREMEGKRPSYRRVIIGGVICGLVLCAADNFQQAGITETPETWTEFMEACQKLKDAGLDLVTRQPETAVTILADGRRLWRVFDNLMNNICKYAQRGTRVYLTLEERDGQAVISFKNTSRAPLDIPAEELLERFVRGDAARTGEGNGLGLSIAKSIAEAHHGTIRASVQESRITFAAELK